MADYEQLRDAVAAHRATITGNHLRWGAGPDHPEDRCDDPECSHVPQIVSADVELWHAAGVDKAKWYEHPVARLTRVADKLRGERDEALARVADLLAERDRLRDGIRQHREAVEAAGAFVWDAEGNPYQPRDRSLWSLLRDAEEVRRG